MSTASASIIAPTWRPPRRRSCWPRLRVSRAASSSASAVTVLELGRPRAGVPELRHPRPALGRSGGADGRPRLVHRVVSALRLLAERLRRAVRRETRSAAGPSRGQPVTWSGKFRPPLDNATVYPRPEGRPLPIWIAVGGTPNSVVRAGTLGLPMALAIIGGQPAAFAPHVDLYRRALEYGGHDPATPLAVHSHGYVFDDEQAARAEFLPAYRQLSPRSAGSGAGRPCPTPRWRR